MSDDQVTVDLKSLRQAFGDIEERIRRAESNLGIAMLHVLTAKAEFCQLPLLEVPPPLEELPDED